MAEKRPASDAFGSSQMVVKRQNTGTPGTAVALSGRGNGALVQSAPRTSGLEAPVMELSGHTGEVFAAKFNPEGNYIASGSMDRSICESRFLWVLGQEIGRKTDMLQCYGGRMEIVRTMGY
jgi:Prp8 binding protein